VDLSKNRLNSLADILKQLKAVYSCINRVINTLRGSSADENGRRIGNGIAKAFRPDLNQIEKHGKYPRTTSRSLQRSPLNFSAQPKSTSEGIVAPSFIESNHLPAADEAGPIEGRRASLDVLKNEAMEAPPR
jgi:hypothetical protein